MSIIRTTVARAFVLVMGAGIFLGLSGSTAHAVPYYSFTGEFAAQSDVQVFYFHLGDDLDTEGTYFRTWHCGAGGTNAAGIAIPEGGFDPALNLYNASSGGTLIASDDDISRAPNDFNALIDQDSAYYSGEIPLPSSLSSGDYQLELTALIDFDPEVPHWAVDLVGIDDDVDTYLSGLSAAGSGSTLSSMYLGSNSIDQSASLIVDDGFLYTFSDEVVVGQTGFGSLSISSGSSLSSGAGGAVIGADPNSVGEIRVNGVGAGETPSQWTSLSPIIVGQQGGGLFFIYNGGTVSSPGGTIAQEAGSNGSSATVHTYDGSGRQSVWNLTGNLEVGNDLETGDSGTLYVKEGGKVQITGGYDLIIRKSGTVLLYGGTISAHSLTNAAGGTLTHTDGLLEIDGGEFRPSLYTDCTIDGGTPADRPVVKLLNGATAFLGGPFIIGNANHADLEILSGSRVTSISNIQIGNQATSTLGSNLLIDGEETSLVMQESGCNIYVGYQGKGILTLKNGGKISSLNSSIIYVNLGSMFLFENGELDGILYVEPRGGTLRGYGYLDGYVESENGTIDTPSEGQRLIISGGIEIASNYFLNKTGVGKLQLDNNIIWREFSTFHVQEGGVVMGCDYPPLVRASTLLAVDEGASVEVGGSCDPFTDSDYHVGVENNGLFSVTAGDKVVAYISGEGDTAVLAGSLTAASITQHSLTIGGGGVAAVPEPGTWMLLLIGLQCFACWRTWIRKKCKE